MSTQVSNIEIEIRSVEALLQKAKETNNLLDYNKYLAKLEDLKLLLNQLKENDKSNKIKRKRKF